MEGYRKIIAALIPIIVGAINATVVGINVPLPKDTSTWGGLIQWLIEVVILMAPTVITIISTTYYTKKNVEEAKAFAIAEATAPKPTITPKQPQSDPPASPVVYQYTDADALELSVIEKLKKANALTDLNLAFEYRVAIGSVPVNKVIEKDRVRQARELIDKSRCLFEKAFVSYTGQTAPSLADLSNLGILFFKIKKEYERANNIVCSNKTFEEIKSLLNFMDDYVRLDAGLIMLEQATELNYSNLPSEYSALYMAEYAGSIVK